MIIRVFFHMVHAAFMARISSPLHSCATFDRQTNSKSLVPTSPFEAVIMDNFTWPLSMMSRTLPNPNPDIEKVDVADRPDLERFF
jgi:hypothetical protein